MNGDLNNAYAWLAQLKVALPLARAASMHSADRVDEQEVSHLIDMTRDLTARLTKSCDKHLTALDFDRRSRLMRSVSQEAAFLVAHAHERGENVNAAKLVSHVLHAIDAAHHVPCATVSLPYTDTLSARVTWELAVAKAKARLAESMLDDPAFCVANIKTLLTNLLDRVNQSAAGIKANNDEERLTVRVSLLNHFSKSHARLIARVIDRETQQHRAVSISAVLKKLDVYHTTLGRTFDALNATEANASSVLQHPSAVTNASAFSPEI